ncbi:MAG: ketol-acid reductoisomerase [Candidatus Bathyarchaeota archaeon]|nr:MAG: ketol-acid reductoisomerase [Candidatus Bathyarchaeota archaeon]
MKIYYDKDVNSSVLDGKTIAVIGYGSQGYAQANCIKDSGLNIVMGLRMGGKSWERANRDRFPVFPIPDAVKKSDVVMMLVPDTVQPSLYKDQISPYLKPGKTLVFAHGFNIHFKTIVPPTNVDIIMVAPKAPGPSLRELYLNQFGVPALIAIHQDYTGKAKQTALSIAKALGSTKAGVIETTFKDETESDLIGEQIVLVGGIIELLKKGFEVLVELGYPPELAYFETCNEIKLIVDQIYHAGVIGMLRAVSDTAKYGGMTIGPKVIDARVKNNMKNVAKNVQSGEFAKKWLKEDANGRPIFNVLMKQWQEHQLETVGKSIRSMSGIEKEK